MEALQIFLVSLVCITVVTAEDIPIQCSICVCSQKVIQYGTSIKANCSNRNLTETPLDLPKRLGVLDLSYNDINSTHSLHLEKYPNVRHLNVSFNMLNKFELSFSRTFDFQILTLDLSGNVLHIVNNMTFNRMPYIRDITGLEALEFVPWALNLTDIKKLAIISHETNITKDLFQGLKVTDLKVNFTNAMYLPEKLFRYQWSLLSNLLIAGRVLVELHENSLRGLTVLKTLEIIAPNMRSLPQYLLHDTGDAPNINDDKPVNLRTVRITGVKSLPRDFFRRQNSLETISIHGAEDLPFGLYESVTLDSLDLSGSKIYEIPADLFKNLPSLKILNLSNTGLSSLHFSAFNGLQSLISLDISSNSLDNVTQALFHHLRKTLSTLIISNNSLDTLDKKAFQDMLSLETLDLSHNRLKSLHPTIFNNLGKLVDLNLKGNQLFHVPSGVLDAQVDMQDLDLGTNELTSLPPNVFSETRSLRRINLAGNNITFIPRNIFETTHFLEHVDLKNNPIHCDCNILIIPKHVLNLKVFGSCSSPAKYASLPIDEVADDENCLLGTTLINDPLFNDSASQSISPTPSFGDINFSRDISYTSYFSGLDEDNAANISVKTNTVVLSSMYLDNSESSLRMIDTPGHIHPLSSLEGNNTTVTTVARDTIIFSSMYLDNSESSLRTIDGPGHVHPLSSLEGNSTTVGRDTIIFSSTYLDNSESSTRMIDESIRVEGMNTTAIVNVSNKAGVGAGTDAKKLFGSLGLNGFYIAMSVVAFVFILGSVLVAVYRRRLAARSMVYVVNSGISIDQMSNDPRGLEQSEYETQFNSLNDSPVLREDGGRLGPA